MDETTKAKLLQALGELRAQLTRTRAPGTVNPYCRLMESFCAQLARLGALAEVAAVEPFIAAQTPSLRPQWKAAYRTLITTPTGASLGLPALPELPRGRRPRPANSTPRATPPVEAPPLRAEAPLPPAAPPLPARLYDPRIDLLPVQQRRWARMNPSTVPRSQLAQVLIARAAMEAHEPTLPVLPPEHPIVKDLLGREVPLGAFIAILIEWIGADRLSEAMGLDLAQPTFRGLPDPRRVVLAATICVARWARPAQGSLQGGFYNPQDYLVPRAPNNKYAMAKVDLLRLAAEAGFTPMHLGMRYMTQPAARVNDELRTRYEIELDRWPGRIFDATNAYRLIMSGPQKYAVQSHGLIIPETTSQKEFDFWFDESGEMRPEALEKCLEYKRAMEMQAAAQKPTRTPEQLALEAPFMRAKLISAAGKELRRMGPEFCAWFDAHRLALWWHARLVELIGPPDAATAAREQGKNPEPLYLKPTLGQHVTRQHRAPSHTVLKWQWEALEHEWNLQVPVTESVTEAFAAARATLRWQLRNDGRLPPPPAASQRPPTNEELLTDLLVVVPPPPPANWVPPGMPYSPLQGPLTAPEMPPPSSPPPPRSPPPSPQGVGDTPPPLTSGS
jgi:hypothetical protein